MQLFMAKKLTRTERKQIEAIIAKNKQKDKNKMSAQDSIPFQRIFPDGICRVNENTYTKSIRFADINYQLNTNEDKSAIFDGWCDFLNYFDSTVKFQLSFINRSANRDTAAQSINIPMQDDEFDSIRTEYTEMLKNQLAKGNNGLTKTKYLTFSIEASGIKAAKPKLERIETDILNNFKRLGVSAEVLNGYERLEVMHGLFHMDEEEPFSFSWDWLVPSGLSAKDFIAPSSFEFKNGRYFGMGKKLGAVSFLQILAPELNDRLLADFLAMESSLVVTMHVQSVDQIQAIKTIKRKITDLDRSKIDEQKKAVRGGYDFDILPSDLVTYGTEAKKLLQDLQSRNERKLLKSNHQSQQFRMQDDIMKHYPEKIENYKHVIAGLEADMKTLSRYPHPTDGFAGMEVKSDFLADKDNAGAALLEAFKDAKGVEPVSIGSYRGFTMLLTVEDFGRQYVLLLKGELSHRVELGKDARGNLIRIDNVLNQIPTRIQAAQAQLENVRNQLETAKTEVNKPFPKEDELKTKSVRLNELNAELNIDEHTPIERVADGIVAKSVKPSILDKLKSTQPIVGINQQKKKCKEEAL